MSTVARLRNYGVPSLKIRRFAGTIKGEPVEKAMAILDLQSSPTCQTLAKLLRSAVANAVNNDGLAAENLVVSNVLVDVGPTMKRIKPRARGRAYRILKRSSHVTIEVDLRKDLRGRVDAATSAKTATKPAAKSAGKPATKATTKTATKSVAKGGATKTAAKSASKSTGATKSAAKSGAKSIGAKSVSKSAGKSGSPKKGEE
jgi:large subunit ribosomal protein L22